MNNKYDVIIGLEIHLELNSCTKIFSPSKVVQNTNPNSFVHQNDLGMIGTLPTVNKKCIELGLQTCKILNLKIDSLLRFDRKNYIYFDLPKGYQITQQFYPIGKNGYLPITLLDNTIKKIEIERAHLEEDTAKQINDNEKILLDYNRCGIGLIEIVTKPVIHNSLEATLYVSKLQELISYSKISNAKMNEGSMRCDVNISLKPKNSKKLGQKVEIKNLNSINNIKLAIEYEILRQSKLLDNNKKIDLETRRFDELQKVTILMRKKYANNDYHFFPEPNISPIKLSNEFIQQALAKLPMPISNLKNKLQHEYNLNENQIKLLLKNENLLLFFNKMITKNKNVNLMINYFFTDVLKFLNKHKKDITETHLTPEIFVELINYLAIKQINSTQTKNILEILFNKQIKLNEIINKQKNSEINDNKIYELLTQIINNNPEIILQYSSRKDRVLKFYMGQLMKLTKGKADPTKAIKILEEIIEKQKNN